MKPRATIEEFFNGKRGDSIFLPPIFVLGLSVALESGQDINSMVAIDSSPIDVALSYIISLLLSLALTFLFVVLVHPWLTKTIGRLWNGKATSPQIANVFSLALIPHFLILAYQILAILAQIDPSQSYMNAGVDFILYLVSLRILLIGISVIQEFSYGFALLNLLMTALPYLLVSLIINS
ncbi:MAG: hypothetical protein RIC80_18290 [Cyclobacteriaceae bacterium]